MENNEKIAGALSLISQDRYLAGRLQNVKIPPEEKIAILAKTIPEILNEEDWPIPLTWDLLKTLEKAGADLGPEPLLHLMNMKDSDPGLRFLT